MKKILATILALMMVFSLSVSALAEDKTDEITINGTSYGTVEVTIADATETVYSVTVAWDGTTMEYMKDSGVWDPENHEFVPNEETEERNHWIDAYATVIVTNHSNAAVTATIDEHDITTGTTYEFDKEYFDLGTAVDTVFDEAPNNSFNIEAISEPVSAGSDTFVVTISQYVEPTPDPEPIELDLINTDPLVFNVDKNTEYTFNVSVMSFSAAQDENQEDPVNLNDYSYSQMTGIFTISDSYAGETMYLEIRDDGMDRYYVTLQIAQ